VGSVGAPELIVIFLVALIVLGPDRLPKAARQMGKAVAEFRRVTSGFQDEVRKAMDDVTGSADQPGGGPATSGPVASGPVTSGKITGTGEPAVTRPVVPVEDLPPPPDDPSRN
jgi:Tat protein translocase TatB subunit